MNYILSSYSYTITVDSFFTNMSSTPAQSLVVSKTRIVQDIIPKKSTANEVGKANKHID